MHVCCSVAVNKEAWGPRTAQIECTVHRAQINITAHHDDFAQPSPRLWPLGKHSENESEEKKACNSCIYYTQSMVISPSLGSMMTPCGVPVGVRHELMRRQSPSGGCMNS